MKREDVEKYTGLGEVLESSSGFLKSKGKEKKMSEEGVAIRGGKKLKHSFRA